MGFFDKVKSLKNAITGGAAEVTLSGTASKPGIPFEVVIRAHVDDMDLEIESVLLEIEGREVIHIPDYEVSFESEEGEERKEEPISADARTFSIETTVAGEQTLNANQDYEWTVTVELPADAQPRYKGTHCEHDYIARASLVCRGNDPDSGWVGLDAA